MKRNEEVKHIYVISSDLRIYKDKQCDESGMRNVTRWGGIKVVIWAMP